MIFDATGFHPQRVIARLSSDGDGVLPTLQFRFVMQRAVRRLDEIAAVKHDAAFFDTAMDAKLETRAPIVIRTQGNLGALVPRVEMRERGLCGSLSGCVDGGEERRKSQERGQLH